MGGNSERRIGKYLLKYPENRRKIFLVTKSHAWTLKGMTKELNQSLERMKTDYIDLFFVHGVSSISELDEDKKAWAEKSKAEGKIRLFGFSTHTNMEVCMMEASKLGWIDGINMPMKPVRAIVWVAHIFVNQPFKVKFPLAILCVI